MRRNSIRMCRFLSLGTAWDPFMRVSSLKNSGKVWPARLLWEPVTSLLQPWISQSDLLQLSSRQEAGIQDVTLKLFPGDRHEILNELDKEIVDQYLLQWMEGRM